MPKHIRYYALLFQSLFILPIVHANEWDWVPRESLTATQQSTLNQYCRGTYIDGWEASDGANTHLLADMIYRDEQGTLHMKGAATLRQPASTLNADVIQGVPSEYYQADGHVTLRAENQLIRSSSALVSNTSDNKTARFDNAKFLSHSTRVRGAATQIARAQDGVIFIKEGFYTTCEPGETNWQLYGSSIELNPNSGFGTAKHIQIRIDGIPVFYFPWLRFPIDDRRQTGFLFPSFSYDGDDNLTVSAPFYLNLAPNYDATITPNLTTRMGPGPIPHGSEDNGQGLDVEFRHLSRWGQTVFEQSTYYDDTGEEATLRKLASDQQLTESVNVGILLEDNPTLERVPEVNTTSIGEKDSYERNAYAQYNKGNFSSDVTVQRYQTPDPTVDKPLEWLPRVNASYGYATSHFSYSPDVQFTDFYEPDENTIDGQRTALNQDISINTENAWGTITLGTIHHYRDYNLHRYSTDSDENTSLNHLSYYLDTGVTFERTFKSNNQFWRQTLEPRLTYLNSPYTEQSDIPNFDASEPSMTYTQAFAHSRFSGNDRVGDTEQIALGLESRFYDSENVNRWTLKGGQIFYLKDRRVGLTGNTGNTVDDTPRSALLTSASYNGNSFTLTNNFNYDLDEERVDLAQTALNYKPDSGVVFNLSFSYVYDEVANDRTKQSSFSTIIPLSENWHVYHQQAYDWIDQEQTKNVNGLGYENCCVKASLSHQRWRDDTNEYKEGIFLQFILRSLSGVGRENLDSSSIANDYWNAGKVGY
ncbi:LPS-assembly protein LptD [Marinomonas piezotolerans]|uniref:LPS-assembly protein LptD n=1 Tax=Marinomonas piezotolerans TaxID=2213058 RepID=A0A370U9I2_9GAMM|nr:LPS assembly protein LptD [Marinomonas piezotolerans]RDL44432.1 LPS-assembly protein LptD [Marinomonas piezotolerans]